MRIKVFAVACGIVLLTGFCHAQGALRCGTLRCEYRTDTLGVDTAQPRLSWTLQSDSRSQVQSAFQIMVASTPDSLAADDGDLWDSGKVFSRDNVHVVYDGLPVRSFTRCFWKVRVWDAVGRPSPWSEPAWWETAMLQPADWEAQWITDGKPLPTRDEDFYLDDPAPVFRKAFALDKTLKSARLYITGLGCYDAYINGKPLGDAVLDPGWTAYSQRVLYSTYDVTDLVRQGANVLAVMLGNGWYNPLPMRLWGRINLRDALITGRPRLLAQLRVTHADGTITTVVTDHTWKVAEGPILRNNIYLGEVYDARRERAGWNNTGFDDSAWGNAKVDDAPIGRLRAQDQPPVRITKTVRAVKMTQVRPGMYIFDMGQNFSGWVRLRIRGQAGARVKMRFGELLNKDGTLNVLSTVCGQIGQPWCKGGPGAPAVADQADTYILKGGGEEVYTPRFTWHCFRYVELTGWSGPVSLDMIEGLRLNAALPEVGTFACSNEMFNRLQEVVQWTILSNVFSVQSDCPGRERFGYGGDIVACSEAVMLNYDMATFYAKAVRDFADAAQPEGGLTETAPFVGIYDKGLGGKSGPIGWGAVHPMLLWQLHQYYGDKRLIAEQYETARRWIEFLRANAKDHLISVGISDHASVAPKPEALTSTAFYYYNVRLCSRLAEVLGNVADAKAYARLAEQIKAAFNRKFFDASTAKYHTGTQACQAFALYMDLVEPDHRTRVLDALVKNITVDCKGHLSTGIFGTKYMLHVLTEGGRADTACTIADQRTRPGWGYMLANGATTLWEEWDGSHSHNHPMFGSVSEWFYRAIAGINPHPDAVAFDRIIISPRIVGDLTWAEGAYDSVRGAIRSQWRLEDGAVHMNVTIPPNTRALVHVPADAADDITESGRSVVEVKELTLVSRSPDSAVFEIGSGTYAFTSGRPRAAAKTK